MAVIPKNNLLENDQNLFNKSLKDTITPQEWNKLGILAHQLNIIADAVSGGSGIPTIFDSTAEFSGDTTISISTIVVGEYPPKVGDFVFSDGRTHLGRISGITSVLLSIDKVTSFAADTGVPVWSISEDNPTDNKSGDFWFKLKEGIEEVDSTPLSVDIDPEPFEYETYHDDDGNADFTPLGIDNDSDPFEHESHYDVDGNFILNKEII